MAETGESSNINPSELAIESARLMTDLHCENVIVLDVHKLSQVTKYIVIGNGTSDRQMYSVAEDVADYGKDNGHPVFRSSHERSSNWIVIDFVDVIVHIFEPNTRAYYDLESLWIDAVELSWKRPQQTDTKS